MEERGRCRQRGAVAIGTSGGIHGDTAVRIRWWHGMDACSLAGHLLLQRTVLGELGLELLQYLAHRCSVVIEGVTG